MLSRTVLSAGALAAVVLLYTSYSRNASAAKPAKAPLEAAGRTFSLRETSKLALKKVGSDLSEHQPSFEILEGSRWRSEDRSAGDPLSGLLTPKGSKGTSFIIGYDACSRDLLERRIVERVLARFGAGAGIQSVEIGAMRSKLKLKQGADGSVLMKRVEKFSFLASSADGPKPLKGKITLKALGTASPRDLAPSIFVSAEGGDDRSDGSRQGPLGTIRRGIELARGLQEKEGAAEVNVIVAGGLYREGPVSILDGINLIGGFSGDFRQYDPARFEAAISGNPCLEGSGVSRRTRVEGFTLEALDGAAGGESSVAVLLIDIAGLILENNRIVAGNGARGSDGRSGGDGAAGNAGHPGGDVVLAPGNPASAGVPGSGGREGSSPCAALRGSTGGNGGNPGAGGQTGGPTSGGGIREVRIGGRGGLSGYCEEWRCGFGRLSCSGFKDPGEPVDCGPPFPPRCDVTCEVTGQAGDPGAPGQAGAAGAGAGNSSGSIRNGFWVGAAGGNGESGTPGFSGEGGGGGGGYTFNNIGLQAGGGGIFTYPVAGAGGGGGGAGGCPGAGGEGGGAGGGSFGIFSLRLGRTVERRSPGGGGLAEELPALILRNNRIESGRGGAGGNGGPGGAGGGGGEGGVGGKNTTDLDGIASQAYRSGGAGGVGGSGGPGGAGGGGAGGVSYGIFTDRGVEEADACGNSIVHGAGGAGGKGPGGNDGVGGHSAAAAGPR